MKNIAKIAVSAGVLMGFAASATAQEWTNGYIRPNGTVVQPYHHTMPDSNRFNNYSMQGNVNPYTSAPGTVNPYSSPNPFAPSAPSFGSPYRTR